VPKILDFKTLNLLAKKNNKSPAPELRRLMMINENSRSQLGISPSISNLGDAEEPSYKLPGMNGLNHLGS
jgi:hypothetical protein